VDGKELMDFGDLVAAFDVHDPGDRVTLTVRRGTERREVPVTLRGDGGQQEL
jgi:S1-C subfamily serine protease